MQKEHTMDKHIVSLVRVLSSIAVAIDGYTLPVDERKSKHNNAMVRVGGLVLKAKDCPFTTEGQLRTFIHNALGKLKAYEHKYIADEGFLATCEGAKVTSILCKGIKAGVTVQTYLDSIKEVKAA